MNTLVNAPIQLKITGAVLAIAALAIALAWVAMTAGPTMAQTDPYDDPKPCGPDQVPDSPDETITSGHYAVFDAYWDFEKQTLNNNLCPPAVVHTPVVDPNTGVTTEFATRTASNIDIGETVFHLDSTFEHTLTADDVENYDFFNVDDAVGQTVWWIRTGDDAMTDDGDPNTTDDVETESALQMGFSAGLFDSKYWYLEDPDDSNNAKGIEPLQYEFEAVREPGIPPSEYGHFFAFDDSAPEPNQDKTAVWDSSDADTNELQLYPGEYKHLQWAFTKPGTYVLSVHLKGHVRQGNPHKDTDPDYDENWKPISPERTVTSEVKRYTFHVGPLTLNHEPAFQVERSVEEHSANDTLVGVPVSVYQGDDDTLTYSLSGPGHSLFSVEADANGDAQLKVAGDLDYEAFPTGDDPEYRLTLGVSDGKNHEDHPDSSVDHTISINITVTDQPEAERSVAENSAENTLVGAAVEVTDADTNTLAYTLSGHGHNLFTVERDTATGNAQIKVAGQGGLDHEVRSTYHLTLGVTGYSDPLDNYTIRVTITVTNVDETNVAEAGHVDHGLTVTASSTQLTVGETVYLRASIGDLPEGATNTRIGWVEEDPAGSGSEHDFHTGQSYHDSFTHDSAGARAYRFRYLYDLNGQTVSLFSNKVEVTWSASN